MKTPTTAFMNQSALQPMKIKTARFELLRHPAVVLALCLATALTVPAQTPLPPVVTGVIAFQQMTNNVLGTNVIINYTLSDANFTSDNVFILVSQDAGNTWTVPALTFSGAEGANISVSPTPTVKSMIWYASADWPGNYTTNCRVRVLANNVGLVLIPPGYYNRGDALDGESDAPVYPVYVSALYMDSTLVTGGKWNLVVQSYATSHGYGFDNPGSFKAVSHPVQTVNWYDAVKWCNARSQMEGLSPCYYTSTALYTNGDVDAVLVNTNANGYRLPTEAEWEKAARGGLSGQRFPWGNTISESQANYYGTNIYSYDSGPDGFNATYATGAQPYTSPDGSFAANGYGLSDMAGNVGEWCWDWYLSTYYAAQINPPGPGSGSARVTRGGAWLSLAPSLRCANRLSNPPAGAGNNLGFRCVRGEP
jgi:formylglycine-generating enzyme required for sulfatase activity